MFEVLHRAMNRNLVVCLPSHPFFCLASNVFFFMMHIRLGLPHSLALGLSYCIYGQPLDLMGIHFFHCTHGGERMLSHDVVRDAFASITRYSGFHVVHEQTHVLLSFTLESSCWWADIVLLVDGICTLANVIIVDSI